MHLNLCPGSIRGAGLRRSGAVEHRLAASALLFASHRPDVLEKAVQCK